MMKRQKRTSYLKLKSLNLGRTLGVLDRVGEFNLEKFREKNLDESAK